MLYNQVKLQLQLEEQRNNIQFMLQMLLKQWRMLMNTTSMFHKKRKHFRDIYNNSIIFSWLWLYVDLIYRHVYVIYLGSDNMKN